MPNIIQIEELVYTRLPRISKSEWLTMLSKQGVANDYALLLDDYLLIEQTDYRFSNGNYISSERTVYNIDYITYDTAENTPNPVNTEEIITVRYDSTHDRYYVYYTHFPIENIPHTPDLSHILSEADIPSSHPFVQAPAETSIKKPIVQHPIQPAPKPKEVSIRQVETSLTPKKHKKWRRIDELKAAYKKGKTLDQIVEQFECTREGAIYQLKTYLNIEHPFETKPQHQEPKQTDVPKGITKEDLDELQTVLKKLEPWQKSKLKELRELYQKGYCAQEIARRFNCTQEEICLQLANYVGVRKPFVENDGKPWTNEDEELLLFLFVKTNDVTIVAQKMRRTVESINKKLYLKIGRTYPGMPKEKGNDDILAKVRRNRWMLKKVEVQALVDADRQKRKEEKQHRHEDNQKNANGFYREDAQIVHPLFGKATVVKDDENVTILSLPDGTRKRISKKKI